MSKAKKLTNAVAAATAEVVRQYEIKLLDRDEDITRISGLLDEAADRIDSLERDVDEWADKYAESEDLRARLIRDVAGLEATLKAVRAESGVTEEMPVIQTGMTLDEYEAYAKEQGLQKQPLPPVTKSAVEVPRGDTPDAGEGRVIAFMPMSELEPGMKFRLDNGTPFETALYVEHDKVSESAFGYDDRATIKVTVKWGGSGHFRPERIAQVDVTPLSD